MPRFRKRPVEVEAIQFTGANFAEVLEWVEPPMAPPRSVLVTGSGVLKVCTLEGDMIVSPHDWIIRGVAGELYPCKPDIFERTYEAA